MATILRVLTRLNVGGPTRQALILHERLRARGHSCVLAAGRADEREGEIAPDDLIRLPELRRDGGPQGALVTAGRLRTLIADVRPDIVHTHMAMAGFAARSAAWTLSPRPKLVHTFHGHVLDGYFSPVRSFAYTAAERTLARGTDAIITIAPQLRDELSAKRIGAPSRWHLVPLGLELDALAALEAPHTPLRRIGIVGRLVAVKDHATFLEAAARLPRDLEFVVAGDGELRSVLEEHARRLDLPNVRFAGWQMDLPRLYDGLDVVVMSSRNEGTPVALIEAMAAGRPVVATDVGGTAFVAPDAPLVRPGHPDELAAAIQAILDAGLTAVTDAQSRRTATVARFSAQRLVDDIDALYARLLSGR